MTPQIGGTGTPLRLESFLKALSRRFRVHLISFGDPVISADLTTHIDNLGVTSFQKVPGPYYLDARFAEADAMPQGAERLELLKTLPVPPQMRFATQEISAKIDQLMNHMNPDAIHVARSDLLPCLLDLAEIVRARTGRRPLTVLDIDDDETESLPRFAQLQSDHGLKWGAAETRLAAEQIAKIYRSAFSMIDQVCVCSERDRARLQALYPDTRVRVLANVSPARVLEPPPSRRSPETLRLFFVGHLGYVPNVDTIETLINRIVPEIRRRTARTVVLEVVGRKVSETLSKHWKNLGIELHTDVDDLAPHYARADVVALPLRSAGGTRIKILEAFAYGVPVISTEIGAEGLEIEPGHHAVIAETVDAMAAACISMTENVEARAAMIKNARELVRLRYGANRADRDVMTIYSNILAG